LKPREDLNKLMDDMDPALLDFVKTRVTSFIRWELLRFLYENPGTADSAENIARYTGRSVNTVRPELDELVKTGVVTRRVPDRAGASPSDGASADDLSADNMPAAIYTFDPDQETHRLIETFVKACQDRQFRIKAVYHVIQNRP
jgi:hypothetical protein